MTRSRVKNGKRRIKSSRKSNQRRKSTKKSTVTGTRTVKRTKARIGTSKEKTRKIHRGSRRKIKNIKEVSKIEIPEEITYMTHKEIEIGNVPSISSCECNKKEYFDYNAPRKQTNELFTNFFQKIFHAGNKQQFIENAKLDADTETETKTENRIENIVTNHYSILTDNYNLSKSSILNTFNYFFDILKKGIFVQIKNGKIFTFLPFNNANYINDWGHLLKGPGGKDPVEMEIQHSIENPNQLVTKGPYKTKICTDKNKWYANYFMFKNQVFREGPLSGLMDEGDHATEDFKCLIEEVCEKRYVPDICFFMNPRDYPVIKKNLDHPYDLIFRCANKNIPKINKQKVPILSQSSTSEYSDIIIPNEDDIKRLVCKTNIDVNTDWESKKNIAVFRGSATGPGVTKESNQRIKLAIIGKNNKNMDVALTGENNRLKLDPVLGYCDYINMNKLGLRKGGMRQNMLTPKEQSGYKYIIHIQGHVAAFRLSKELGYNSLIIKVDSPWKVWFSDQLRGYTIQELEKDTLKVLSAHYIRAKEDLTDINEVINWCIKNDSVCKHIAGNAYDFWNKFLKSEDYMLDYMNNIFWSIANNANFENNDTLSESEEVRENEEFGGEAGEEIIRDYMNKESVKEAIKESVKEAQKVSDDEYEDWA